MDDALQGGPLIQIEIMRRSKLTYVRLGPYFEGQKLCPRPISPQNPGPILAQIPGKSEGSNFSVEPARGARYQAIDGKASYCALRNISTADGGVEVRLQIEIVRRSKLTYVRLGPYFEDQKLCPRSTFLQDLGPIPDANSRQN